MNMFPPLSIKVISMGTTGGVGLDGNNVGVLVPGCLLKRVEEGQCIGRQQRGRGIRGRQRYHRHGQ